MDRFDTRRLLRLMADHGMAEFSYADPECQIELSLDALTPLHPEIRATQAGRFLSRHPAVTDAPVFPRRVRKDEIVAFLKIGALLVPLVASDDAFLPQPLFGDGEIVGYGDILF
ncbi:MAG: hypothetical protein JWM58_1434 [Rhizobium sp.]|nr:hypothetical protein [Rhizobium sp.]